MVLLSEVRGLDASTQVEFLWQNIFICPLALLRNSVFSLALEAYHVIVYFSMTPDLV